MPDPGRPEAAPYPAEPGERNRWVESLRPPRPALPPGGPVCFLEAERTEPGGLASVAVVLLTTRECPWRCVMCDLWQHALPAGAPGRPVAEQLDQALARLAPAADPAMPRHIKLYNAGSFFDAAAIPRAQLPGLARRLAGFDRVIVESHPALALPAAPAFARLLREAARSQGRTAPRLEVAMGLETAHPETLARLNKRTTPEDFARAAAGLRAEGIAVRCFLLVHPPFLAGPEAACWAERSVDFAFDSGASVVALIAARAGNGALEALARQGAFTPPRLEDLEAVLEYGAGLGRGLVAADTWGLEAVAACGVCRQARTERLKQINSHQHVPPPVECNACGRAFPSPAPGHPARV